MSDADGNGKIAKVLAEQVAKGLEATQSMIRDLQEDIHEVDKRVVEVQGKIKNLYHEVNELSNLTKDSGKESIITRLALAEDSLKKIKQKDYVLATQKKHSNIETLRIKKELILGIVIAVAGVVTGIWGQIAQ